MKTIKTLSSFFQSSAIASRVFIPAIVMLIAAVALPMPAQELAPALLREDLHGLRESLEEGHSGLYRYTPKAEMDRAFERAESHLNHPMSWRQFYALVLPIVARIRCGLPERGPYRVADTHAQGDLNGSQLIETHNPTKERIMIKPSTDDKTKGNLHEVKGAIKQKAGELTENPNLEADGRAEKNAGKVQKVVGKIEKAVGE